MRTMHINNGAANFHRFSRGGGIRRQNDFGSDAISSVLFTMFSCCPHISQKMKAHTSVGFVSHDLWVQLKKSITNGHIIMQYLKKTGTFGKLKTELGILSGFFNVVTSATISISDSGSSSSLDISTRQYRI